MVKAIIFDIGDVFTHGDFSHVYTDFAERVGVEPKLISDYFSQHLGEMLTGKFGPSDIIKEFGLEERFSLEQTLHIWKEVTLKHWSVDEDMLQLLRNLKKHYKLIALTNLTETRYVADQSLGLYDFFDHALLSFKEGLKKPDPKFFNLALEKAEATPDEVIYIDDLQRQVDAATRIGIKSILFKSYQQLIQEFQKLGIKGI